MSEGHTLPEPQSAVETQGRVPTSRALLRGLPSVDQILRALAMASALEQFGRAAVTRAIQEALAAYRFDAGRSEPPPALDVLAARVEGALRRENRLSLRPVFNLTGTVLHTNLGRALLAQEAIAASIDAMRNPVSLEYDIERGGRGERDDHLRGLLRDLTGAEDATVVNNNAAAVILALNTLGAGRDAIVSRGELIEIGGAFRMPDIMRSAGVTLVEVGTTNRTHPGDYRDVLSERTALIFKVHTSNYRITGFTAEVDALALAKIAREASVPLVNDLGSGTLIDLSRYGLAREPTVREAVADGADLVLFSGDKLLGGPQAGFIVGRKELIAAINRNPMKRALRLDKLRIAALEATLRLYNDPDRLVERLPTLRLLSQTEAGIRARAERLRKPVAAALGPGIDVTVCACRSEIGSGALPVDTLPSAGLSLNTRSGHGLDRLAAALRALPRPIIGRISAGALVLDMRCLEDENAFVTTLAAFDHHAFA